MQVGKLPARKFKHNRSSSARFFKKSQRTYSNISAKEGFKTGFPQTVVNCAHSRAFSLRTGNCNNRRLCKMQKQADVRFNRFGSSQKFISIVFYTGIFNYTVRIFKIFDFMLAKTVCKPAFIKFPVFRNRFYCRSKLFSRLHVRNKNVSPMFKQKTHARFAATVEPKSHNNNVLSGNILDFVKKTTFRINFRNRRKRFIQISHFLPPIKFLRRAFPAILAGRVLRGFIPEQSPGTAQPPLHPLTQKFF